MVRYPQCEAILEVRWWQRKVNYRWWQLKYVFHVHPYLGFHDPISRSYFFRCQNSGNPLVLKSKG